MPCTGYETLSQRISAEEVLEDSVLTSSGVMAELRVGSEGIGVTRGQRRVEASTKKGDLFKKKKKKGRVGSSTLAVSPHGDGKVNDSRPYPSLRSGTA